MHVTFSKRLSLLWASTFSSVKEYIFTNLFLYLEPYACKGLHLSSAYQNSLNVNLRILLSNWKYRNILFLTDLEYFQRLIPKSTSDLNSIKFFFLIKSILYMTMFKRKCFPFKIILGHRLHFYHFVSRIVVLHFHPSFLRICWGSMQSQVEITTTLWN